MHTENLSGGSQVVLVLPSGDEPAGTRLMVVRMSAQDLREALPRAHVVTRIPVEMSGGHGSDAIAREVLQSLTATALRAVPASADDPSATVDWRAESRARLLHQAKRFIDDNLHDTNLSPEVIARGIHVSRRYLHLIFKDTGLSVSRFVRARRMAASLHRLADRRHAHLPIADVASRLGFKDPSHFARVFKATYGVSPRQYRAKPELAAELLGAVEHPPVAR